MRVEKIGNATLYLGDCQDILPTLGKVDAVVTDPPYEDELHKAIGRIRRNDGREMIKELGFEGINSTRENVTKLLVEKSSGWVIIFTLAEGVREWRDFLQENKAKYDTCLAWVKPDCSPRFNGQGAARGFECAVTAWCGTGYRRWNAGGKRGIYIHNVNGPNRQGKHPTEKPVSLMKELLLDYTNESELILDPFMGSGTTGVACAKMGRSFIGIERDPEYFDIACRRIEDAYKQGDMFVQKAEKPEENKTVDLFGAG